MQTILITCWKSFWQSWAVNSSNEIKYKILHRTRNNLPLMDADILAIFHSNALHFRATLLIILENVSGFKFNDWEVSTSRSCLESCNVDYILAVWSFLRSMLVYLITADLVFNKLTEVTFQNSIILLYHFRISWDWQTSNIQILGKVVTSIFCYQRDHTF